MTDYFYLEFNEWSHLLGDKINPDDYEMCSQDKEQLQKEKETIVEDIMNSFEDYEIMDLLPEIGVGYAVRTYWDKIKDEMLSIVCDDLQLYTALLRCIITDDLMVCEGKRKHSVYE